MNKRHISFSEYRLFVSCNFKHYLVKRLKFEEETNEFLVFGSALHSSIEDVIKKKLNKILWEKVFTAKLEAESNNVVIRSYFGRNFIQQGTAILKELNFFERFKDWEVVGVEDELYELLYLDEENEEEVYFKGIVDLILKKGDKYLILDWKSATKPWDIEKKKQDKGFFGQLALYKHFFSKKYNIPIENIETRFVALARDPINVQQYDIVLSDEFSEFVLNDITQAAKAIKKANPTSLLKAKHNNGKEACKYCPLNKKVCTEEVIQVVNDEEIKLKFESLKVNK
jgi:hypothetical protein